MFHIENQSLSPMLTSVQFNLVVCLYIAHRKLLIEYTVIGDLFMPKSNPMWIVSSHLQSIAENAGLRLEGLFVTVWNANGTLHGFQVFRTTESKFFEQASQDYVAFLQGKCNVRNL